MAERKRRGLGRGLGALINSDAQDAEASGATAHTVTDEVPRETGHVMPDEAANGVTAASTAEETGTASVAAVDAAPEEGEENGVADAPASGEPMENGTLEASTGEAAPDVSAEDDSEGADDAVLDEDTTEESTTERPIDVFFSAKSHLGTQRVSRGTRTGSKTTTTSRRTGGRRAQMPDVMSERQSARTAGSASSPASDAPVPAAVEQEVQQQTTAAVSTPSDEVQNASSAAQPADQGSEDHSWTDGLSEGSAGGSVDGAEFRSIPVTQISPNPRQPRTVFDEDDMAELVHSIREIGVLQPIVVREIGPDEYELVMGERRWRASQAAQRAEIPAIVRFTKDDDLLRDALLENIHRSQLNPLEEAAAYRQLLDDFNCTQDELAEKIGRSRPQISNTLRLMKLPPSVQRRVAAGVLSSGHARALLGLTTPEEMEELATRIVAEGLSVRATEEAVTLAQQQDSTNGVSRGTNRLPSTARYQQLDEYADALTDRLDTQVKITLGAKKGRIAIDFGSIEDLHRLMEMIGQHQHAS